MKAAFTLGEIRRLARRVELGSTVACRGTMVTVRDVRQFRGADVRYQVELPNHVHVWVYEEDLETEALNLEPET